MTPESRPMPRRVLALVIAVVAAACSPTDVPLGAGRAIVFDLLESFSLSEARRETGLTDLAQLNRDRLREHGFVWRGQGLAGIDDESWTEFYSTTLRTRELTLEIQLSGWYRRLVPSIDVYANYHRVAVLQRSDLRTSQRILLPKEVLRQGTNRISLRYKSRDEITRDGPRVTFVQLSLDAVSAGGDVAVVDTATGPSLRLPAGARQEYFADIPAEASLALEGIRVFGSADEEILLSVEITREGNGRPQLEIVRPDATAPVTIAIEGPRGATRIALTAIPQSGRPAPEAGLELSRAQVLAPTPSSETRTAIEPTTAPNVLIYLIDTLRADHLGIYGYARATSPYLDAFAADAIVFDAAQAQSSWTKPVVASMMTGLLPQEHGVQGREDKVAPDARTLAGILQLAGYATYAVSTNSTVFSDFNFDIGFHEFVELGERPTEEVHQLSDAVNLEFFEWLDTRPKERPFFAFLHTMDPHEPYAPREPYRSMLANDVLDPTINKGPAVRRARDADPTLDIERVRRDMEHLYDAEIAFNDAQFGALVERLKAAGLYDSLLIIVLSDHGDEFMEHGGWSHGATLYQEVVHVPLLVKLPGQARAGERVAQIAQHIDIFPTVMQVAGLDYTVAGSGMSLLDLPQPGIAERRPAISHLALTASLTESVRVGAAKLIRRVPPGGVPRTRLFDLTEDPAETMALARPVIEGLLRTILKRAALAEIAGGQLILDPEMTERMRALGYIQD